jgi:hypothetical protein
LSTAAATVPDIAWSVERLSPVAVNIRIPYAQNEQWEQWGLITADRHIDNPKSNLPLQRRHLQQARERGAFVIDLGDAFDAMQGKSDQRSRKADIRPELLSAVDEDGLSKSYLNALVDFAAEFFEPYAGNIAMIGQGNHESAVDNIIEYDLLGGLLYRLSVMGSQVTRGGFRGWIKFSFEAITGNNNKGHRSSKLGYYHHGYGGGGPVTRGVIQTNRQAVYLSNADYVFSGHTHDKWYIPISRTKLLLSGAEVDATQYHIKVASYKDEYFNQGGGWHHERGGPPKPIGAWWVRWYYSPRDKSIKQQFIEADV